MGIYFKFSPQKSDYSRTYYYFDVDKQMLTINYQTGETVVVKKNGIYCEHFRVYKEEKTNLSFAQIISNSTESSIDSALNFVKFVSVDENNTIKVELLKQYGKDQESEISYLYPDWYYLNENKWDYEITDLKTFLSVFGITIKKWTYLLSDINNQIYNLTLHMKDEVNRINQNRNIGSQITIRAIKSSILSLQFNYLEALSNFIANLIIEICNKTDGAPTPVYNLSNKELAQVNEEGKFTRIEDKISLFPEYLAKILGVEYRLNKSGLDWQNLKEIKKKRDMLTHPKMTNEDIYINLSIDNIRPAVEIKDSDIFVGFEVLYWYNSEIENLFQLVGIHNEGLNDNITFYMLFLQLGEYSSLTDKELDEKYKFTNSKTIMNAFRHFA